MGISRCYSQLAHQNFRLMSRKIRHFTQYFKIFVYCTISDGFPKMSCGTLVKNHWSVGRFVLSCLVQEVIISLCMNYCEQHFGIPFSFFVIMVHVTYKYQYFQSKSSVYVERLMIQKWNSLVNFGYRLCSVNRKCKKFSRSLVVPAIYVKSLSSGMRRGYLCTRLHAITYHKTLILTEFSMHSA